MLKIRKTAISLEEGEVALLARIVAAGDEKEAFNFLKKKVYPRLLKSQRGCEVLYGGKIKEICLANPPRRRKVNGER